MGASPPAEPGRTVVVRCGAIGRTDIGWLCDEVRSLLEDRNAVRVVFDVRAIVAPDVSTVDALARLQLTAARCGRRVHLRGARSELDELIALVGLRDVLPPEPDLHLEPLGDPEQREQSFGIEEEADPRDLPT
jgi:ABC-type transporter Mla MlaB component